MSFRDTLTEWTSTLLDFLTRYRLPSSLPLVTRRELFDFREEFLDTWL
ncbi:hypothetical protein L798_07887 [Zootermopsis nevadensis]|uniref:Uncharacterized protein n=1 Tax=Zootermopsis nevadensis TaxID=136037 RepID=A0A067R3B5_ZOONE|nr:hypothetical protein L798_07887 [Zootermopsis nevadensis]